MTTFNFKVRATDDKGAFADRDFSIDVRNTVVNRFVATTHEGHIITSIDGTNWTYNINQLYANLYYCGDVIYGNGFWLITKSNTTYLYSIDGTTWEELSFPQGWVLQGSNFSGISRRWSKGGNVVGIQLESSGNVFFWTTTDGRTWTQNAARVMNTTASASDSRMAVGKATLIGDKWWFPCYAQSTSQYWYNLLAVTIPADPTVGGAAVGVQRPTGMTTYGVSNVYNFGGLIIIPSLAGQYFISNDGGTTFSTYNSPLDTTRRGFYSMATMIYGNGRIITLPEPTAPSANAPGPWDSIFTSTDAKNWTASTMPSGWINATNVATNVYTSYLWNTNNNGRILGTFYNGVYLFSSRWTEGTATTGGFIKSTDGINWTRVHVPIYSAAPTDPATLAGVRILGMASMGQNV